MTVYICGPNVDEKRIKYIYWKYSKLYPRRWARRECKICKKSEIPPRLYVVRRTPNKEYLKELVEKDDMLTLIHLYEHTFLVCEKCLENLNPREEGKY